MRQRHSLSCHWQLFARAASAAIASGLLAACSGSPSDPAGGGSANAPNVLAPVDKTSENQAKTAVNSLIRAQMAFFVEQGEFADNIGDLGLGFDPNAGSYQYRVDYIDGGEVHVVGVAQQPDLHSFVASAFVVDAGGGDTIVTVTCVTNAPSQTPPDLPPIPANASEIACAPGSGIAN